MNKVLLPLIKIESMTSLEIAELLNTRHDSVRVSIERLAKNNIIQLPPLTELKNNQGHKIKNYSIPKRDTYVVVAQMSPAFTAALVDRWIFLEQQLEIIKFHQGDKKHQLDAMEALSHLLPDDLTGEALSYIKANTVVNKAVSNLFGFHKMLRKADMSNDMLHVRENVLDDYIKLYEVIGCNCEVKDILYKKYQPLRIEGDKVRI